MADINQTGYQYKITKMLTLQETASAGLDVLLATEQSVTNTSGNDTVILGGPQPLAFHTQVVLAIMYSIISLMGIVGNVTVCYIVLFYQRMRTVTNFFIVNLALGDITMAVLCVPFTLVSNVLSSRWLFGRVMCTVVPYAQVVSVFLSALTLVAISLDRLRAVILPLKPKLTTSQALAVIAIIWIFALLIPLPTAILSRLSMDNGEPHCDEEWGEATHRYIYSVVIMILQYFLPLFVLAASYTWIGVVMWIKKPPGEAQSERDQRMAASKRKVSRGTGSTMYNIHVHPWPKEMEGTAEFTQIP